MERLLIGMFVLALAPSVGAATITADIAGSDTATTFEMYRVAFTTGLPSESIQSVAFDVSVYPEAHFDFDGSGNLGGVKAPVLGTLSGLMSGDISVLMENPPAFLPDDDPDRPLRPTRLTFNFVAGVFGVGDFFTFGADVDRLIADGANGSYFGLAGIPLTVILQGGGMATANFVVTQPNFASRAVVNVPEPLGAALFGAGLAAYTRRALVRRLQVGRVGRRGSV